MSLEIYLTTSKEPVYDSFCSVPLPNMYRCLIWAERPIKRHTLSYLAGGDDGMIWSAPGNPPSGQSVATLPYIHLEDLAALGFPPPGEMRVVDIGPCEEISAEDIPELCYSPQYLAENPPADQYELKTYVDEWAAGQAVDDTGFKQHGLAWLALDELARIEYCEAYLPERED